jgi:hypothetical protein
VEIVFAGLDAGNVDLNLNDAGIDAIHGCAQGLIEHEVVCLELVLAFRLLAMKSGRLNAHVKLTIPTWRFEYSDGRHNPG